MSEFDIISAHVKAVEAKLAHLRGLFESVDKKRFIREASNSTIRAIHSIVALSAKLNEIFDIPLDPVLRKKLARASNLADAKKILYNYSHSLDDLKEFIRVHLPKHLEHIHEEHKHIIEPVKKFGDYLFSQSGTGAQEVVDTGSAILDMASAIADAPTGGLAGLITDNLSNAIISLTGAHSNLLGSARKREAGEDIFHDADYLPEYSKEAQDAYNFVNNWYLSNKGKRFGDYFPKSDPKNAIYYDPVMFSIARAHGH